jgi:hypothetical protein
VVSGNSGIGQHIEDPVIDIAALARAQGVEAEGPITRFGDLLPAMEKSLRRDYPGTSYLLDVIVTRDYPAHNHLWLNGCCSV